MPLLHRMIDALILVILTISLLAIMQLIQSFDHVVGWHIKQHLKRVLYTRNAL